MNLPRWLSDARTVESRMGWPRKLSKKFVSEFDAYNFGGDAMQLWPLSLVGCILGVGAGFALMCGVAAGLPIGLGLPLVLAPVLVLPLLPTVWFSIARRARLHRTLFDYHAAPWCLTCRYPVPSTALGASPRVCPECGEPIPPEIAALAAERSVEQAPS